MPHWKVAPKMLDREKIDQVLSQIGHHLKKPSKLVIVGSTASMLSGQDDRRTPDIDIWFPMSDFDPLDLKQAVEAAGMRYDPHGEIDTGEIYIQILRPGITMYPAEFETHPLGSYGNLSVSMPPPALMVATKLARAFDSDLEDVAWWMENSHITRDDIEQAIALIPQAHNREEALANLVFIDLGEEDYDDDYSPSP